MLNGSDSQSKGFGLGRGSTASGWINHLFWTKTPNYCVIKIYDQLFLTELWIISFWRLASITWLLLTWQAQKFEGGKLIIIHQNPISSLRQQDLKIVHWLGGFILTQQPQALLPQSIVRDEVWPPAETALKQCPLQNSSKWMDLLGFGLSFV